MRHIVMRAEKLDVKGVERMNEYHAIRDEYGHNLTELGGQNPKIIVLDADVSNSTRSVIFGQKYPERFINCGIAETNMVSVAAGLAAMGWIPVVNTFSFLLCERALDQIRADVAYNNLNVKFAAAYGGMSDSFDGASHHSITDLGIIRSIPGMSLVVISDSVCMKKALKPIMEYNGPVYFRLCREKTPVVHNTDFRFKLGKGEVLREGRDLTIIATGIILDRVLKASEILAHRNIDARVIEIHTVKPIDAEIIIKAAVETGAILTCEEANKTTGLGSAVSQTVSREFPVPMDCAGIDDVYAESGSYTELLDKYGLSVDEIVNRTKRLMTLKGKDD